MEPCTNWTVVITQYHCCVDAAVSTEDLARVPQSAYGVLAAEVDRLAGETHGVGGDGTAMNVSDPDCVAGFPKTTKTVTVCLRPVRVMLMPTGMWWPVGSA